MDADDRDDRMVGTPRRPVRVPATAMRGLIESILRAVGCGEDQLSELAEVFVEAELSGVGLQGLDHLHTLVRNIRAGRVDPVARPAVAAADRAYALVDGRNAPGPLVTREACRLAVEKAFDSGVAMAATTHSSDIFMLAYYARWMADAGAIGLVFHGSPPLVHAHGGTRPVLGTNPLAVGIPRPPEPAFVFDISTSAVSQSRVRQAAYHDESFPAPVGLDSTGRPTMIAKEIETGAISPLAGHKGFGLSLVVALLSAGLVGAGMGPDIEGWLGGKGRIGTRSQLVLAIDPGRFIGLDAFARGVNAYLDEVRRAEDRTIFPDVRIPGERAHRARQAALSEGVTVLEAVLARGVGLARDLGAPVPREIETALAPE